MSILINKVPGIKQIMDFYRDDFDDNKSDFENYVDAVIDHASGFYESLLEDDETIQDVDWNDCKTVDVGLWNYAVSSVLLEVAISDRECILSGNGDEQEFLLRCLRDKSGEFMIKV